MRSLQPLLAPTWAASSAVGRASSARVGRAASVGVGRVASVGIGRAVSARIGRAGSAGAGRVASVVALAGLWSGLLSPAPAGAQTGATQRSALQDERVERLLETRVACRGCHVIDGRGGLIGPVLDGVSSRADLARLLEVIRDPATAIPGTIMPRQTIPGGDEERLAAYILDRPVGSIDPATGMPQAPPTLDDPATTDGAALYARHCAACHGATGAGDGWNAANLSVAPTPHADAEAMSRRPDDSLFDVIHAGGYVLDRSAQMPAFGGMLEADQIRALVAYIRQLCSCTQPEWAGGTAP